MGSDADGIVVKADGRIIWETDDLRCHYALIDAENVGEKYTVSAYYNPAKADLVKKCALPGYATTLSREILEKLQNDF